MTPQTETCQHPIRRQFAWFAHNPITGKADILCIGCCECGAVLRGGISLDDEHDPSATHTNHRPKNLTPLRGSQAVKNNILK